MSLALAGARGGFYTVLSQLAGMGLRVVSLVVLARLIAPGVFGSVAIVTSIVAMLSSLIYLGLPAATAQAPHLSHPARSTLFYLNSAMGFTMACSLFLLAPLIAELYADENLVAIARWLAFVPLAAGIGAQLRQQLIRRLAFVRLAAIDTTSTLVGVIAALSLALLGYTYVALIAQAVLAALAELILVAVIARWLPGRPGDWKHEVRPLLRIAGNIFGANTLRNLSRSIVTPVMGVYVSPTQLGLYDRAQQLTLIPVSLTVDQLQRVVVPILSRVRDEPERMLHYMQRFQLVGAYLTSTGFLLLAALAYPFVITALGQDWVGAAPLIQLIAIGSVFRAAGQSMQWLFIAGERTGTALRLSLWTQPAIAAITLCGLPWGVGGVALAGSLAWLAYWPVSTITAARSVGFPARELIAGVSRGVLFFALPVSIGASLANLIPASPPIVLALGIAFGALTAALLQLAPAVRRDCTIVTRTIHLAVRRQRP